MRRVFISVLAALLLCALPPPVGAQDPEPGQELKFSDAAGDAGLFGVGATGVAPTGDAVDLVSFRLYAEDFEGFVIEIGVKNVKAVPSYPGDASALGYALVRAYWKVDASNVNYELRLWVPAVPPGTAPTGTEPIQSSFNVYTGRGGGSSQRAIGTVDWDKSLFVAFIPKASLLGKDPVGGVDSQPAGLPALLAGTRLVDFYVTSTLSFPNNQGDRMPDSGVKGPYVLGHPAANDRVRVRVTNPQQPSCPGYQSGCIQDFLHVSVSPDSTALVQLTLENLNGNKRILDVKAEPLEKATQVKWEVRVLEKVTIPGSDARIINLIVNVSRNAEHGQSMLARVTARSLGFPDEIGALRVRLVASIPPSPNAKDLFFHAKEGTNVQACFNQFCNQRPPWLNTLEKDPAATGDGGFPLRQNTLGLQPENEYSTQFRLDTPLNADLVLNPNDKIVAVLNFRTVTPIQGTVRVDVMSDQFGIGSGSAPYASSGPTTVSITPLADAARIPEGAAIFVRVVLRASGTVPFFFTTDLTPQFVPQGSKLTLPVIPDPNPKSKAIPFGPAFITLAAKNSTEEFVNPGKVKVFQVTIVNEGVQEDVVTVKPEMEGEVANGSREWFIDLRPGSKYRLKSGESATFGLLVKPPAEAEEGDQARITLNATSGNDPAALAQLFLSAIVTRGVEIEDESENFTVDEETFEHYEFESHHDSPGVGAFAAAGIVVTAAFFVRRRRA
ncbi:MAG: hypothetical protein HYT80_02325 [Euryarchaeota archaeon]|nr:hypothetical protein [Euryarchaeota archaeon]